MCEEHGMLVCIRVQVYMATKEYTLHSGSTELPYKTTCCTCTYTLYLQIRMVTESTLYTK